MFRKVLRLQKVDVDDWWTGYAIAIPGIAGSVISFLYFGAGLWSIVSVVFRRYPINVPKRARFFVLACVGYALVLLVGSCVNDGVAGIIPGVFAGAGSYFVPLLISRFRASDPRRALETLCNYAPVGALFCFLAAYAQSKRVSTCAPLLTVGFPLGRSDLTRANSGFDRQQIVDFSGWCCNIFRCFQFAKPISRSNGRVALKW